jgi:hypothetical protein
MDEDVNVVFPPTAKDLRRAGTVILLVGLVLVALGCRFFLGTDPADRNAAVMVWIVAVLLVGVGTGVVVTARRRGAPETPR